MLVLHDAIEVRYGLCLRCSAARNHAIQALKSIDLLGITQLGRIE